MYKYFFFLIIIIMSSCENSGNEEFSGEDKQISISSPTSKNESIAFGQTYQHQVTTSNKIIIQDLSHILCGENLMAWLSSSGMIEWTPNKASHIKTHKNIKILLETVSGYDLVKYFDITVTGMHFR